MKFKFIENTISMCHVLPEESRKRTFNKEKVISNKEIFTHSSYKLGNISSKNKISCNTNFL